MPRHLLPSLLLVCAAVGLPLTALAKPEAAVAAPGAAAPHARLNAAEVKTLAGAIDQCVEKKLKAGGQTFNPLTTDAEFVRRVWLDVAGRVPTADEAHAFLIDRTPDKRAQLIDRLLASPAYTMRQFNWLADMLRVKDRFNRGSGLLYTNWLKERIKEGVPWDELVRQMLCADGKLCDNGATGFLLRDADMPLDGMSNLMTTFLGANMACAQCHDHPSAEWTQHEFYQMAAFFGATNTRDGRSAKSVQMRIKNDELTIPKPMAQRIVFANIMQVEDIKRGQLRLPPDYKYDDAKPRTLVAPKFMAWGIEADAKDAHRQIDLDHPDQWRASFAKWLTHPDNPRFAVNIANRTWKKLFGQAVREPVGDLDDLAAASNPELLALLGQTMKTVRFDLGEFQRVLLSTRAYQAAAHVPSRMSSSAPGIAAPYAFQGPLLRRMGAEQAWDSLVLMAVGPQVDLICEQRGKQLTMSSIPGNDFSDANLKQVADKLDEVGLGRTMGGGKNAAKKADKLNAQLDQQDRQKQMKNKMIEAIFNHYTGPTPKGFGGSGLLVRASELQQPAPETHFLRIFGQSDRLIADGAASDGSVPQALALMNGPAARVITDRQSVLIKTMAKIKGSEGKIDFLWRSFYARAPDAHERQAALKALETGASEADLVWSLLNSHEFLFVQ